MSLRIVIEYELQCDVCGKKSHRVGYQGKARLMPGNHSMVCEAALFQEMKKEGWEKQLNSTKDNVEHFCGDCCKKTKTDGTLGNFSNWPQGLKLPRAPTASNRSHSTRRLG
jgi:hypothetical protein